MVKVISLSDEAYGKLSIIKRDLSFSKVIISLIEEKNKKSLRDFAGVWSEDESEKFKTFVKENRKKQKMRRVNF